MRFSPTAWAKLLFFRDRDDVEIGGFGITGPDDLPFVDDFATVRQFVSGASVLFEDEAVGDFFDAQVDAGRQPEQFARIWLHTHPGDYPRPSGVDDQTFARVFGGCQWAAMFVLGRSDQPYARMRFNVGPGSDVEIPVVVDYGSPFPRSNHEAWEAEYKANVRHDTGERFRQTCDPRGQDDAFDDYLLSDEHLDELEAMDPEERRRAWLEMTARSEPQERKEALSGR